MGARLSVIDACGVRRSRSENLGGAVLKNHPESRGLYSQTKLEAERIVTDAVRDRKLRAIILRPGEVYGPDKLFLSGGEQGIYVGIRAHGIWATAALPLPVIWIEDLVDAIMAAADSDRFDNND